jgi:uridine monophosphate synthetase
VGPTRRERERDFFPILEERAKAAGSLLCVGLDPKLESGETGGLFSFGRKIIEATREAACAYKTNIAFYEAHGPDGLAALKETIDLIHSCGIPVILDAKRGDIPSTAEAYAKAAFDVLGADALTVNPLLGGDSVESFASRKTAGVFILCHTSNPGARDVQELIVEGAPLYEKIARLAVGWNSRRNIGLVMGATFPEQLERIRRIAPDMWFLLPGIGSQGGDLAACLEAGLRTDGSGMLVNVSRGISESADQRAAALEYRDRINELRKKPRKPAHKAGAARTETRQEIVESIAIGLHDLGAVRFGEFTLKSGLKSPIYVDLRLLVGNPKLLGLVAQAMADLVSGIAFDRIAAIPYGGLPIGTAVSLASGKPLIYPRKEIKDHGTKQAIEGVFNAGETAIVLDDLISTGGSKIEAMNPLLAAGLKVRDVMVLIDREQGGAEEIAAKGYRLHAVFSVSALLDILAGAGRITADTRAGVRAALGLSG